MSQPLINHSPDLKKLRDEGYVIRVHQGLLVVDDVPYVNAQRDVKRGQLVMSLVVSGDKARRPNTHVSYFVGEPPCDAQGGELSHVIASKSKTNHAGGITSDMMFSQKPRGGYTDYYQQVTTYVSLLTAQAGKIEPGVTAQTCRDPDPEDESVFNYLETASGRAGIGELNALMEDQVVAIIGLGGTGSYVLDLIAKTPVKEIRLFDDDYLQNHNAFRAPGAASLEQLRDRPKKVDYFRSAYSKMRKDIIANPVRLEGNNLGLLDGVTSAFICVDTGQARKAIVGKLAKLAAPYIDVGMGLKFEEGAVLGMLRVTAATPDQNDHIQDGHRIPLTGNEEDNVYSTNIQVADLNCLNAAFAVIKWKKLLGFYHDFEQEHFMSYTIDGNQLENEVISKK